MGRKITITKEYIVSKAYELADGEGLEGVTARKLANCMSCSTQPIFRVYQSMDELLDEVYIMMCEDFAKFYSEFEKSESTPFVDLGMAYIAYARQNQHFFEALFLKHRENGKSLYEILNGTEGYLVKEIKRADEISNNKGSQLFMKMWIFIHGAACMVITKDYDLDNEQTKTLLIESYESFSQK